MENLSQVFSFELDYSGQKINKRNNNNVEIDKRPRGTKGRGER